MKVVKLSLDRANLPKCSAKLSLVTRLFWHGRGRPQNPKGKNKCDCYAAYKIDGKPFCKKHGGLYLIERLSEEQKP